MIDWDSYGTLHLVLLHLPIGLFVGVLALELGLSREKHEEVHDAAIGVLLPLCLFFTILTVRLGYALGQTEYNWEAIADHRNTGYFFLGFLTVATLAFWWTRWRPSIWGGAVYGISLTGALIAMILTGHYGGVITHGEGTMDELIPAFIKPDKPTTDSEQAVVVEAEPVNPFTNEAWVILDKYCVECHGLNKRKGGYRIDVPRLARAGGESHKKGIIPGKPDASELIHRIMLPREDEKAMPPSKKPGLSPEQIDVLRSWIEAGGQFPGEENKKETQLDPKTVKQLEAIRELGAAADFTPWGDGAVLVNLSQMEKPDWELCHAKLLPLASKLVWLNAANHEWPPEFYDQINDFSALQRLHLQYSNVTDGYLEKLTPLKQLYYLNLTSTKVTLAGLRTALTLPELTELYVHGLEVKTNDLKKLRAEYPNVEIPGQTTEDIARQEKK